MVKTVPNPKHLSRMYFELSQEGAACSGEKYAWPYRIKSLTEKIVLAAEMSRWDPRLLGILVEFCLKNWQRIIPQDLRQHYPKMTTPQTVALVAEFCRSATGEKEIQYFMEYLQRGVAAVLPQFYFKGLYAPGGKLGRAASEKSLKEYKKWGFMAREAPTIDVYSKKTVGSLDRSGRLNLLQSLFEKKTEISMTEYQQALRGSISRQQALSDLKKLARLKRGTKGRGAKWVRKVGR